MRAIIWKELRENLKWGALILAGTGAGIFFSEGGALYWLSAALAVWIGASAGGLLLGIFQVAFDAGKGRWPFLIHRPVSKTTIFLGKAVAGLSLLMAAAGLPWVLFMARASLSHAHPAPFYPGMWLPGLAGLLGGVPCYFAGMAVGLRKARWYGSRILGLGVAAACTLVVPFATEFSHALIELLAGILVAALAAWGIFLAGNDSGKTPRPARAALGASILLGLGLLWLLAISVIGSLPFLSKPVHIAHFRNYRFKEDGTAFRAQSIGDGGTKALGVEILELDGRSLGIYKEWEDVYKAFPALQDISFGYIRPRGLKERWLEWGNDYRAFWYPGRFFSFLTSELKNEIWLYSVPEKILRGYNLETREPTGTIGPGGFYSGTAEPETRFTGDLTFPYHYMGHLIVMTDGIWESELQEGKRSVRKIFAPQPGDRILGEGTIHRRNDESDSSVTFAIATSRSILILDKDWKEILSIPWKIDREKVDYLMIGRLESSNQFLVRYQLGEEFWNEDPRLLEHVTVVAADGAIVKEYDLPYLPPGEVRAPSVRIARALAPALSGPVLGGLVQYQILETHDWASTPIFQCHGRIGAGFFLSLLIGGALSAALTFAIARRYAFSTARRIAWTLGNLFLGPPGLLLLFSLEEWPALEVCPSCSRKRVVTRETCERCGAYFRPPARDGTEIFEEEAPAAAGAR